MNFHIAGALDAKFLFELRNLDSNRLNFKNSNKVDWDSHLNWIEGFFKDKKNRIYIYSVDNQNIGMFRINKLGDVSVSLIDEFKRRGFGSEIIKTGTLDYLSDFPETLLSAEIKFENLASIRAFEKAGYRIVESEDKEYKRLFFKGLK